MCSIKEEEGEEYVCDFNTSKNVCQLNSVVQEPTPIKINEENDQYSTDYFDEKPIQDAYFDSKSAMWEKIGIREDDQVEDQSTLEGEEQDFVEPKYVLLEELDIKIEDEERDLPNTDYFDEKPIQDAYFDSKSAMWEKIGIREDDQVEDQSTLEGEEQDFVEPKYVLLEELDIKIEDEERDLPNTEESQNEVNLSLKPHVKSEPKTLESEDGKSYQQKSKCFQDTVNKEESFAESGFSIHEEVDVKPEEEISDQSNDKPARDQTDKWPSPSNKTDSLNDFNCIITNSHLPYDIEAPVFKCFNCSFQTHTKQNISEHVRIHMTMPFKCSHCRYKTWKRGYLRKHQAVHASQENVELHKCPECPFTSRWSRNVTSHLLVHKNVNEVTWYQCPECPYKTKREETLKRQHMLIHVEDQCRPVYKCTICSYQTDKKRNLWEHLKRMHRPKNTEENIVYIACPQAGCFFQTCLKSHLTRHVRECHNYDKFFTCLKCSYRTKDALKFKAHELGHESPDKWLACPLCPFKTTSSHYLNEHAIVHKSDSEVKWFQCSQCSFKTKRNSSLNHHKLTHNQISEKLLECSECRYKTSVAKHLQRHLRRHKAPANKTWFQCSQCPYKASQQYHLKRHSYTHKSEDEIQDWLICSKCPYKTYIKRNFTRHQLVHSKSEKIANWHCCYFCTWKTHFRPNLLKHIKAVHTDAEGPIYSDLGTDDK